MTDRILIGRLKMSITDPVTGEPLDDDARPDLYASDVREVIREMLSLTDRLRYRGVKDAVAWLHRRADSMNDPHARQVLNLAATDLGQDAANRALDDLARMGQEWESDDG